MGRTLGYALCWSVPCATFALGGCATFAGQPAPVFAPATTLKIANGDTVVGRRSPRPAGAIGFGLQDALTAALGTGTDSGVGSKQYRDVFINVQMTAIDGQYSVFREKLVREAKTTNLGLDLGVLALTGTGAVVGEKAANALSAGGSALTGAKAAFNRELYFDKALPALIASMDARRLVVRTGIIERMKLGIDVYSIAAAIADLSTYQDAASLDDAIDQITQAAVDTRDVAKAKYDDAIHVCTVENAAIPIWLAIGNYLRATKDRATLGMIADIVRLSPAPDIDIEEEHKAILSRISTEYCSTTAAIKLQHDITLATGETFP